MILNRIIRAALNELADEIERLTSERYRKAKPGECKFISDRQYHEQIIYNRGMERGMIWIQTILEKSIIGRIL
jgi:hypothetical protein